MSITVYDCIEVRFELGKIGPLLNYFPVRNCKGVRSAGTMELKFYVPILSENKIFLQIIYGKDNLHHLAQLPLLILCETVITMNSSFFFPKETVK